MRFSQYSHLEQRIVTEQVDCAVIGAGVVGLAIARELAISGREVIVLEAADAIGTHTSSRNSEVIHAGLYYPQGSLKARLCTAGKWLLYDYCAGHGVPHNNIGKIVVAVTNDEVAMLKSYVQKAEANGVTDLCWLSREELRDLEPAVECVAGFLSPSTGIVDSHALMLAYLGEAEDHGAMLALKSRLERAEVIASGFRIAVGGEEPTEIEAKLLVNSAGLKAPTVARMIDGYPPVAAPRELYAKGNYYSLARRSPFTHLVYPVPEPGGLGVHVTLDLGGQARFGPDVEWVDAIGYDVDARRAARFYSAIRRYWPGLPDGALAPGYAGIRPKISGPGEPAADFVIQGPRAHGVPGLVNLFGIESPGLTSSLAIAERVAAMLAAAR